MTGSERAKIRSAQIRELLRFVKDQRDPRNVVVVVGDFNIAGPPGGPLEDYQDHESLRREMDKHDMIDLWLERNGTPGPTSDIKIRGKKICSFKPGERLCDDQKPSRATGQAAKDGRIDYIFVEKQKPRHSFVLDVTRPRRVHFKRPKTTEGLAFMSDHIGLEVDLIASKKSS